MPQIALLNENIDKVSKNSQKRNHFIMLGAKNSINWAWKQPSVSFAEAKQKISWIMAQEKGVSIFQDAVQKFDLIWEPWANYIHKPL